MPLIEAQSCSPHYQSQKPKSWAEITISGGGGGGQWRPISNFFKSAKIPKSHYGWEGGGIWWPTIKSQLQNFKVKSSAEISISWGEGVGDQLLKVNFLHWVGPAHQ